VNLLPGVPFAADLVIFVVCVAVIWIAGSRLSNSTDVLSDRLHLGSAAFVPRLVGPCQACPSAE